MLVGFLLYVLTVALACQAGASTATLNWQDNSNNEDGFRVERKEGTGAFAEYAVVGPDVTSYVDTVVQEGTTYCYRVAAFNSGGLSDYTNEECGYGLTVNKAGSGSGTVIAPGIDCGLDCVGTYINGTVVSLIATSTASSVFAGWSGDPDCPDMTMLSAKSCTATFDAIDTDGYGLSGYTGQTECYNKDFTVNALCTTVFAQGQDGEVQAGKKAPVPRYTVNGDGTVTDELTGLVMTQNWNCFGLLSWDASLAFARNLADGQCGLSDGSVAGDWRLMNVKELQSQIDFGTSHPALPLGNPFTNVGVGALYWTSTTYTADAAPFFNAYIVQVVNGRVGIANKNSSQRNVFVRNN